MFLKDRVLWRFAGRGREQGAFAWPHAAGDIWNPTMATRIGVFAENLT
jgi:hypothetical protein